MVNRKRVFDWEGVEYQSAEYYRLYRLHRGDSIRSYKRAYDSTRYKTHPKTEKARRDKWKANNEIKTRIHYRTSYAVEHGYLTRQPCEVCGSPKVIAHHFNYNQILNVMWLCELHHKEWHRNNEVIERTKPMPKWSRD